MGETCAVKSEIIPPILLVTHEVIVNIIKYIFLFFCLLLYFSD